MDIVHPRVAGLDVHKKIVWVAVRLPGEAPGERRVVVKSFKTFWRSLQKMAAWLAELGVTDAAMESTGVIRGRQQASATAGDRPALSVSPSVADGLSAGPSATQIADCGAHLAPTSRRCRFCLPAADASATTRPAQCPIFGF